MENYKYTMKAGIGAAAAVDAINNVAGWWSEDFEGNSKNLGDIFTVRFGNIWKTFKITEMVPERIVWLVTDCNMPWLQNKTEWTGTSIVWEITGSGDKAEVSMTHVGLVPEIECYAACEKGWNYYLIESLLKLLNSEQAKPEKIKNKPANHSM